MNDRPLEGKRVLVTRAEEDCAELEAMLRARGAAPLRLACVAFVDGPGAARAPEAVRRSNLVVVSSPNAAKRLRALCPNLDRTSLAGVGEATARALAGQARFPKEGAGTQALLRELGDSVRGKRVLLPRAEKSTPALALGLRTLGAVVEEIVLYKTVIPKSADPTVVRALQDGQVDAIAFASGSAVRGFIHLVGARTAERSAIACLGPSASSAAVLSGLEPDWTGAGDGLEELCGGLGLALRRHTGYSAGQ
jgi:uroporphyrinogen-III synthase